MIDPLSNELAPVYLRVAGFFPELPPPRRHTPVVVDEKAMLRAEIEAAKRARDLTGRVFGPLTVIGPSITHPGLWKCRRDEDGAVVHRSADRLAKTYPEGE